MAIIELSPGTDASRCPTCGGPMTEPFCGRNTRKYFRHCRETERCNTTTVTEDEPTAHEASIPREFYRPKSLPFTRVGAIDQRSLAAGEREPGEDG